MTDTAQEKSTEPEWLPRLRELMAAQEKANAALVEFENAVPNRRKQLEAALTTSRGHIEGFLEGKGISIEQANEFLKE